MFLASVLPHTQTHKQTHTCPPTHAQQVADEIKAAAATAAMGGGRGGGGGGFGKKGFGKGGGGSKKKKEVEEEEAVEGGLLEGMPTEMALDMELPSEPR
jgi:hypothetical protein